MMTQRLMQMLGAAIVLIALSLAPSLAKAHNGHEHHASVHAGHAHAAFRQSEPAKASTKAFTKASLSQTASKQAGVPLAPDRNCVGDCCSAACAACCAAGLPNPVQLVPFVPSIERVALAPSRAGASREPESIRRPPKSSI
jgi:hypothetical protein